LSNGQLRGNSAVVGLAGLCVTTLLLQLRNIGWRDSGILFCTALFFAGAFAVRLVLTLATAIDPICNV